MSDNFKKVSGSALSGIKSNGDASRTAAVALVDAPLICAHLQTIDDN